MEVNVRQLLDEVQMCNPKELSRPSSLIEYRRMQEHFAVFIEQWPGVTLLTAEQKHVTAFLNHLQHRDLNGPGARYLRGCRWCREEGFRTGRKATGYSATYRKRHLAALRALYAYVMADRTLPSVDPTIGVRAPKEERRPQYVPTPEEVARLIEHPGTGRSRMAVIACYFAPARRSEIASMRYCDIGEDGRWRFTAKNGKQHVMALHPLLLRELRINRQRQEREARRHPAMRRAMENPETHYVFLTKRGKPMTGGQLVRHLKRHAVQCGVGVIPAKGKQWDAINGMTSKLTPHALRRAWASHALNHPEKPVPIDVVQAVLGHKDISTTRTHYALTNGDRADAALREHWL